MARLIFIILCVIITMFFFINSSGSAFVGATSLRFDPNHASKVTIGKHIVLDADETTIEGWFKVEGYPTDTGHIIWNGDFLGGLDPYRILIKSDGYLEAHIDYESPSIPGVLSSNHSLELNIWYHFALVISLSETKLYINGIKQSTILGAGVACKGTSYLVVGGGPYHGNYHKGFIDEVRIWSVARNESQIKKNMWAGSITGNESDLIAYWNFEPGQNLGILYDLSENRIDGEIINAIWFNENAPSIPDNYALDFGEVSDFKYVLVGSNPVFDSDEVTVEAWIKPTSLPTGTYIFEGRSTIVWNGDWAPGRDPYIFYINEFGKLEAHADFENGCNRFICGSTVLTLNTWHHVALTISSKRIKLFVNGRKDADLYNDCGRLVKGNSYLAFGRHMWYNNPFGGIMDEIRIWNTARTEEEIRDNRWYDCVNGDEANLIGYWNFNKGSGGILHDITQNQNHGTIYGATWTMDNASLMKNLKNPIMFLSASPGTEDKTIRLGWEAPAVIMPGSQYIVRYNSVPITESNWGTSLDVDGEPTPGPAGSKESMTLEFPHSGVMYYFALKTQDPYLNTSPISNWACARTSIMLYAGLNMVAYVGSYPMPMWQSLLSIEKKLISVWGYFPGTVGWLRYIPDGPDFLNNMTQMEPGYGYWINVKENCVWDYGTMFYAENSSPSLITQKPPFVLYGKIIGGIEPDIHPEISLKIEDRGAVSYTMGSNPNYDDYYVLEIPVDGYFHEEDNAQIYIDNISVLDESINIGGIGIIRRYDIPYTRIPKTTKLLQNYPNPFNPETWIPYRLAKDSNLSIRIYNISGQLVKSLDLGYRTAGMYVSKTTAAHWDGANDFGERVSSGIYFYNIHAGDYTGTKKMIVIQ